MRNIDLQRIASGIIATRLTKRIIREKTKFYYQQLKRHTRELVDITKLAIKEELPK